uniref:Uncharacterized protein n=1 Tax=Setaria italica TaxID=4555 RepID=K3XU20_SETIT
MFDGCLLRPNCLLYKAGITCTQLPSNYTPTMETTHGVVQ